MEVREWVTVARFTDLNIAQVCESMLREHGIETLIADQALISVLPFPRAFNVGLGSKQGTIKLQVPAEERDRALELLKDERAEEMDEEFLPAEDPEEQPDDPMNGIRWLLQLILFACVCLLIYRVFFM